MGRSRCPCGYVPALHSGAATCGPRSGRRRQESVGLHGLPLYKALPIAGWRGRQRRVSARVPPSCLPLTRRGRSRPRASTLGAASPVRQLLGGAGPVLSRRAGRLSPPPSYSGSSGFSSPELSPLPGPRRGGIDTSLESRVPGRRRTGAGTPAYTTRESGRWDWCWSPRRPRPARSGPGLGLARPVSPRLPASPPRVLLRIPVVP